MTFNLDSAILLAILGAAVRATWLVAEIKTTLSNVVRRLDDHEARIHNLEKA